MDNTYIFKHEYSSTKSPEQNQNNQSIDWTSILIFLGLFIFLTTDNKK